MEAFITRCYRLILGREPEQGGLDYWVTRLKNGSTSAAEAMDGFVNSNEFRNKNLSNSDAIEILYKAMLSRDSEPAGKQYWLDRMARGESITSVVNGFCESNEFKRLCENYGIRPGSVKTDGKPAPAPQSQPGNNPKPTDIGKVRAFLARCYLLIQSREPDDGGLQYWTDKLSSGAKSAAEVVYDFINSNEFRNKHLSNSDIIEILYMSMMDRHSDAGGREYWMKRINSGESMAAIVNGFCESIEFRKICQDYGINPGQVKTSDKVKGTYTGAVSNRAAEQKAVRRMNEAKVNAFVRGTYVTALGREPGDSETAYWAWQILQMKQAPADVAKGILTSSEFRARGIGGEELIRILYRVYANREADPEGLAYWLAKLNGSTPEEIMDGFAASREFKNILSTFWE